MSAVHGSGFVAMSAVMITPAVWLTSDAASERLAISKQSFLGALEDLQKAVEHKERDGRSWQWLEEDIARLERIRAVCPRLCLADCCAVLLALDRGQLA
jgi:hypothetical protein